MRNFKDDVLRIHGSKTTLAAWWAASICISTMVIVGYAQANSTHGDAIAPLTEIAAIHSLTKYEATRPIPVEVEGTVYCTDTHFGFFFLGEKGKFICCRQESGSPVAIGDRVQIKGKTSVSDAQPILVANRIDILSSRGATALDASTRVDFSKMDLTSLDCRWIESEARVQTISIGMGSTQLHCRAGERCFDVSLPEIVAPEMAVKFVGARIGFQGNMGRDVSSGKKLTTVLTDRQFIHILEPEGKLAYRPIDKVSQLWTDDTAAHFHLNGQITYANSAGFFFQTSESGTWIHNDLRMDTVVGNSLDLYGIRNSSRELLVRMIHGGNAETLPRPDLSTIRSILAKREYGRRVRLRGKLIKVTEVKEGEDDDCRIELNSDGFHVAVLIRRLLAEQLDLENATEITVTGTADDQQDDCDLAIFTPSLDDVTISSRRSIVASNWFWLLIGVIGGLSGLSVLVLSRLRQRVNQQTRDLKQLNAELESSYNSVRDGILVLDAQRRVSQFNARAAEILGFPLKAGTTVDELRQALRGNVANAGFLKVWDTLNQQTAETIDCVLQLETPHADMLRTIEVRSSPVRNGYGEYDDRLWTFHDITDQQQLYRSLTHAQKQETVGRMASGFAHDFNNLLTGIICNLTLAATDPNKSVGDVVGCLEAAIGASKRASNLVSHILNFSRKRSTNLQITELEPLLEQLTTLLQPAIPDRIVVERTVEASTPRVRIDENQLEQVLLNICLNACDAISDKGQIVIRAYMDHVMNDRNAVSDYAVISIHDTGNGMCEDVLARIFEPFFTTKAESGSGLGLSMTKDIVQQHGGYIECNSVEDVGTEFRIYLPAAKDALDADSVDVETHKSRPQRVA